MICNIFKINSNDLQYSDIMGLKPFAITHQPILEEWT